MKTGKFISLEGIEGVGKSTAMRYIESVLEQRGIGFVSTREPGGTEIAESIRNVLLEHREEKMLPDTEALLMFASRAQNVASVIKPALESGRWVISDRFHDASFAYQSGGRKIPLERLQELSNWVLSDFKPDLTIILDAPVELGMKRIARRNATDRIEQEKLDFFERARQMYLHLADHDPKRFRVLDSSHSMEAVQKQLDKQLNEFIDAVSVA